MAYRWNGWSTSPTRSMRARAGSRQDGGSPGIAAGETRRGIVVIRQHCDMNASVRCRIRPGRRKGHQLTLPK